MNYLIQTTEVWRVPDHVAADKLEEEFRTNTSYTLTKWAKIDKVRRASGEIVDEWVQITCTKVFNDAKSPDSHVRPVYE